MGGELREIEIDLRNVSSIDELQDEVADGCAAFDEDDLDEDLVMQFEDDATGEWHIVTNSVPFDRVRCARQLRLAPRDSLPAAGAVKQKKGRRSKGGRGRVNGTALAVYEGDDDDLTGRPSRQSSASRVGLLKGPQEDDAASTLD